MLENFGAKRNLYFLPPPCLNIVPAPLTAADIYRRYKQFQRFKKKRNIARKILCFIMNVIITKQKFSTYPIYLSFSKFSYRRNMFWSRNLSSNTP